MPNTNEQPNFGSIEDELNETDVQNIVQNAKNNSKQKGIPPIIFNNKEFSIYTRAAADRGEKLEEMPQVNPESGISKDYINEIASLVTICDYYGPSEITKMYPDYRVKKYEERFPLDKYKDVITDKNRQLVEAINAQADLINADLANIDNISKEDMLKHLYAMVSMIRPGQIG